MDVYVIRNSQKYGPYDVQTLLSYVNDGQILECDAAEVVGSNKPTIVREVLKSANLKVHIPHRGTLTEQLKAIGSELIIPQQTIANGQWRKDHKLLVLALIGLCPSVITFLPIHGTALFYIVSLYFAVIWGLFFYYFFKTPQVSAKQTIITFFLSQAFVFIVWDILGLPSLNLFYKLTDYPFPVSMIGYVFGVGLTEEFAKLVPLLVLFRIAKEPLIPQTMVYYGLMSGIAFGVFEGVQYQTTVNAQLDYSLSFFMNIARLTSLPFLHAVWCGIAGYFLAFAKLYPKYRLSLYTLAIMIPTLLHGLYDTFCGSLIGLFLAMPITFVGVILLMTYLKQGVNYQSKLRN